MEAYIPEVDEALAQLVPNSALVVILGHQGSGKTAQAMRLLELMERRYFTPSLDEEGVRHGLGDVPNSLTLDD